MFDVFKRSWELTKATFSVIKQDKEILIFPVMSSLFSMIFFALMVIPLLLTSLMEIAGLEALSTFLYIIVVFLLYFGVSFIATFFNVGVVFITKTRFEGGDATLGQALKFSVSKIHLIFLWSLVAASVGLFLRLIENMGRKMGPIGKMVSGILVSLLGLVWSIITLFVVPSMVFNNTGPFAALKESVNVLKKTWGENIIQYYGLGLMQFLVIFALIAVAVVASVVSFVIFPPLFLLVFVLFLGAVLLVGILFSTANTVFNTALFWYATTGQVPSTYSPDVMKNAFLPKGAKPTVAPAVTGTQQTNPGVDHTGGSTASPELDY